MITARLFRDCNPKRFIGVLLVTAFTLTNLAAELAHAQGNNRTANSDVFDDELRKVSSESRFNRIIMKDFGEYEWEIDGLTLRGGSETALDSASSEALYLMGFRYFTPQLIYRPKFLNPVYTDKRRFRIPNLRIFLAYGHDRQSIDGQKLSNDFAKWRVLSGVANEDWPAGHTWSRIIAANAEIYRSEPFLLRGPRTFELDDPKAYQRNVELSAAYISRNLNSKGRHAFDPSDSDKYPSETIYRFSLDVVNLIRTTVPNAQLGVYAYAGHRLPVNFKLPGIYIQVALGFNRTQFSYHELVERHAKVADAIMLREYIDVQAWHNSMPMGNNRNSRDYYEKNYPGFMSAGITAVNSEFNENWLANIVSMHHALRFFKSGDLEYESALDEVVEKVFEGDPAVRKLYQLWSEPGAVMRRESIMKSIAIVLQMRESWYRDQFSKYLVVAHKYMNLGFKYLPGYADRLEDLLSNVHGLTRDGIIHSYAFERRLANGNVIHDYPDLWMYRKPSPKWMSSPKKPTIEEFNLLAKSFKASAD